MTAGFERPTLPTPPDLNGALGADLTSLMRYAGWLAGPGIERGLLGPREAPRIWDRHILNSFAISRLLPPESRVVDVGSGAGLPGLVLACARPDLTVDLIEPLLRRTTFLEDVVADLGLGDRVRVIRGRADQPEVVKIAGDAEFVTARAVAPLDRLVRWAMPLLRSGGNLLAIKGQSAEREISTHRAAISSAKADIVGIVECESVPTQPAVRVIHVRRR